MYSLKSPIFAAFLTKIANSPSLKNEILLEGSFKGDYITEEETENELGKLIYRGKQDNKHFFYFVPTPKLVNLRKSQILKMAREVTVDERTNGLEVFCEHVTLTFNSNEKRACPSEELKIRHYGFLFKKRKRKQKIN